MSNELVRYTVVDGVGEIALNRPESANAFSLQLATELRTAAAAARNDDQVRAVLLTGEGHRFCAGGDVAEMAAADDRSAFLHRLAEVTDLALLEVCDMTKPVVVAVQGAVAGAGLGLMLAGDIIVAEPNTKFVTAYASVGLTPDCGVSCLLPRAVGQVRALELLLLNRVVTAETAVDWGLVTSVAVNATAEARAIARTFASGPSFALGEARRLVREAWQRSRAETGAAETLTISTAVNQPEAQDLIARFVK